MRFFFNWRSLFAAVLLLCIAPSAGQAQTTGVIEGVVLDPSRTAVEGATVRATETATSFSQQVRTDRLGYYRAAGLPPGVYRLEAVAEGFRTSLHEAAGLSAGRTLKLDFELEIGAVQEEVLVVGTPALVNFSSADWGDTIDQSQLTDLPLNGRDMFNLANQTPGAAFALNHDSFISNGVGAQISVNGSRPNQNGYRMDGLELNDAAATAPASAGGRLLGLETVREVRLITNPFSAEYGKTAGGVFSAVSRSGSNDFHGSVYNFFRNNTLDARNYFDDASSQQPALRRNQFGAMLSGPIRRDKLFFLVNYEGIRENRSVTQRAFTLTESGRRGDLPGGRVTVAPVMLPYLELYPRPNGLDFGDGTAEFFSEAKAVTNESYVAAKVDALATDKVRTAVRFTFDDAERTLPDEFQLWQIVDDSRYAFLSSETQITASPNTLHSIRLGYSHVRNVEDGIPPPGTDSLAFVPGRPIGQIEVSGLTDLTSGIIAGRPRVHLLRDWQANYQVSALWGRHAVMAGGGYNLVHFRQQGDFQAVGRYRFDGVEELLEARSRGADLMMPGSDTLRRWRQSLAQFYVQDEVRLARGLNITLGLRYEGYTTPREADDKVATLPNPLTDTQMTVGGPLFDNPSAKNFAPRAALAWDVFGTGKTVLRAGGGIFFDLLSTRETTIAGMRVPPFFERAFIPGAAFPDLLAAATAANPPLSVDGLGYNLQQPYVIQHRLSVQQQLDGATVLEVSYAGSRGVHLIGHIIDLNIAQADVLADGTLFFRPGAPRRNPAFGRVGLRTTDFDSNYHALLVKLQRRMSNSLRWQANYTFGKVIDTNSTATVTDFDQSDRTPHPTNLRNQRGPADFDVRHVLAINASWELPQPAEGALRAIFGGWALHGLAQAQSGYHFSPFTGFDRTRIQSQFSHLDQRPSLAPDAGRASDIVLGDPLRYFNPLAFVLPEAGFYGNLGRNVLPGPGLFAVNLGAQKSLWRTERHDVWLRAEFFNLGNRPNFELPSGLTLFSSSGARLGSAGRINSTSTPARQIQLALRWSF